MSLSTLVAAIAFVALFATPLGATVLYVNAATGANSGACTSSATPCKTVTYAMAQAATGSPGDQIDVAPGTYDRALGEIFPIVVKSGVYLRSTAGAERTFLDASGAGKRVLDLVNTNAHTVVEGLRITGGAPFAGVQACPCPPPADELGGGMIIDGGSPTIRKNVFLDNHATGHWAMLGSDGLGGRGGGIYVTAAMPTIVNNVFRHNIARGGAGGANPRYYGNGGSGYGGAIYFEGTGGTIANNTFYLNAAIGGNGGGDAFGNRGAGGSGHFGALYANGPTVKNNIFASNQASGGSGDPVGSATFGAIQVSPATQVSNNFFHGNTMNGAPSTGDTFGTAAVCADTQCSGLHFHGEPSNLRISPNSTAARAGTATGAPADDFDGVTRPNPPSIGAFEPSAAVDPVRLVNLATRARVLTGEDVLIAGFIIGGAVNKTVAVRARGPSLASHGVPGVLANPQLQLFSGQYQIGYNDNWQDASNAAALRASGFAPDNALESALLVTLAPQAYTVIVTGVGSTVGVGTVEVFEVDQPTRPLINIATRGRVLTGDNVMIAGFIIQGTGPQTVVVRGRGPSLAQFGVAGVLANPMLQLYSGQTVIASNDDWQQATNAAQLQASGFAPSDPAESAILVTLQPGPYTAIVSGVGGTTGVATVEVFKN